MARRLLPVALDVSSYSQWVPYGVLEYVRTLHAYEAAEGFHFKSLIQIIPRGSNQRHHFIIPALNQMRTGKPALKILLQ